ncbi:MAG: tRNA (N6-isopentenyl adenosine(37)-C2)-methylthiotransferase MiaB [Gemmatimonadota bacterium]|nr:tRNA (N6-isopentenyl adenosine(37)-C2)-methylthiotransferase MiaB [Gemmatimonadota bacterium]
MSRTLKKRAYVETYGCQMNISDGELMEGLLEDEGYEIVSVPEEADVILVNTCAIREHAERRVLGRVGQLHGLKRDRPELILGVTGCMAQRMGQSLLEQAPYIDLVMGPDGYRSLPERLEDVSEGRRARPSRSSKKRGPQLAVLDLSLDESYEGLAQRRTSRVSAWVPIQRGCDHRCTFCIVPYVRGGEKNRRPVEVLRDIDRVVASGVTEVTLLGQTVNSYEAEGWSFPQLLRAVARVDGIERVRFMSPHPRDVTRKLIDLMANEVAVCEHLHLPVQAGSDRTLRRMLRRYSVHDFLEKVALVRKAIPDISLSTDVIVGFPGETPEEFEETLELLRTVRFDEAYTYRFSPREGTPATRLPFKDFVSDAEAQRRLERLIDVQRSIQSEINRREVGRVEEVLVEKEARDRHQVLGRTRRNKVVAFAGSPDLIGDYYTVRLTDTTGATFIGEPFEAPVTL